MMVAFTYYTLNIIAKGHTKDDLTYGIRDTGVSLAYSKYNIGLQTDSIHIVNYFMKGEN